MHSKTICLILCILIALLLLIAIIAPEWSSKSINSASMKMGLWKACVAQNNSKTTCKSIPSSLKNFPTTYLYLVRIFAILGFLFILASIYFCIVDNNKYHVYLLLAGGIMSLIAIVVWKGKLQEIPAGGSLAPIKYSSGICLYMTLLASLSSIALFLYEKNN